MRGSGGMSYYKAPSRQLTGSVYVLVDKDSHTALDYPLSCYDNLVSFKIETIVPKGKLFGFVVIQKLTIEALGEINIPKGYVLEPNVNANYMSLEKLGKFYVDSIEVNDTKSMTTIVAYDLLYQTKNIPYDMVESGADPDFTQIAQRIAERNLFCLVESDFEHMDRIIIDANPRETDSIYDVLTAICEATGTICFTTLNDASEIVLKFVRLARETEAAIDSVAPDYYYDFSSKEPITLTKVVHATALGDNIQAGTNAGYTQTIQDNMLLDLHQERAQMITALGDEVSGIKTTPHTLNMLGVPYYEPGDCIGIKLLDGSYVRIHLLNFTYTYSGGFTMTSNFELEPQDEPTEGTPSNLTEAIKQTYAKVDRINNTIELLVSDIDENKEQISQIRIDAEGISSKVSSLEDSVGESIDGLSGEIATLEQTVETKMTDEQVTIKIKEALSNGVDRVETSTGFTFDEDGLTVERTGKDIKTTISEDGMKVFRQEEEVLVANNEGVKAEDLHATTYLIIGTNSRFEDYGEGRTGCFWIGGAN
jgi:hypothetical protein